MIIFAHVWLFVLLPLPWVVWKFMPPWITQKVALRVPFGNRIRLARVPGTIVEKGKSSLTAFLIPSLIWVLVVTALARPQWLGDAVSKSLPTRDLLLLVDLSGSMQQEDFQNAEGKKVDRLTAVREVLGDFLEKREGDRVGLVVFGDAPFLQAPFSADLDLSRQLLDETVIGMAGPRTAFGDAIGLGISLFKESDAPAKTIIALTDGNDTASNVPPVEAGRIAGEKGIRLHAVAIGDPKTVGEEKLDKATLKATAEAAGGSYFFAADRNELEGIYAELDVIETREVEVVSHRPRSDLFSWFLAPALLLSFLEKLIGVWRYQRRATDVLADGGTVRVHPVTGEMEVKP